MQAFSWESGKLIISDVMEHDRAGVSPRNVGEPTTYGEGLTLGSIDAGAALGTSTIAHALQDNH